VRRGEAQILQLSFMRRKRTDLYIAQLVLLTTAAPMKVSRSTAFTSLEWLAESQHAQIRDMILSERPTAEIADVAGCNTRANAPD
jgi:hypothetical protein